MQKPIATTPSTTPPHALRSSVHALTFADTPDYAAFVTEVLEEEEEGHQREEASESEAVADLDRHLLADGYLVAVSPGGEPRRMSPERDVASQVMDIRVGQLRRFLGEMPALQSKVLRHFWGIGCERPHSQVEVAEHIGISQASVSRMLSAGMEELCRRFDVPADIAA
jgi:DNA-directed RNA polymerase specialized sigma subunit